MTPKRGEDPEAEIDAILEEVREALTISHDSGEINELIALQKLLELTKEFHKIHSVRELVTKVLDSSLAFVNGERAFLLLFNADGELGFKMGRDDQGNFVNIEDVSPSMTVIDQVLADRKTIIVPDAQTDEVLSRRDSVTRNSLREIVCSPLTIKGETLGVVYIDSRVKTLPGYNRSHINVLASLSDQAAVAIRNAQKFETQT
jgi:GAF domain-containing protein